MENFLNPVITEYVILYIIVNIILLLYYWNSYQFWKRKGVPYLKPSFPFGSMGEMMYGKSCLSVNQSKIYHELKKISTKYGGYYSFCQPTFMPMDPEIIKQIVIKDFDHFTNRGLYHNKKDDPLGHHLFTMEGDEWKNLRTKISPTMTTTKIKSMFQILQTCSKYLEELLDEKVYQNEPLDIKDISARFTTDIISACSFGLESNSLKNPQSELRRIGKAVFGERSYMDAFHFLFTHTFQSISKNVLHLRFLRDLAITNFFRNTIRQTLEYREKYNINRNDMLDILIKLKFNKRNSIDSKNLSTDEIIGQCFILWLAGDETSSSLMTFALYELAQHQDIQDKLRAEIKSVLAANNEQITYEAIEQMTYLEQVIYEILRKYPPLGQLVRICNKDWQIPGTNVTIPNGTNIVISTFGMHYDEEYYPNPEKFDPERFSEEEKANRNPFTYLPFGIGPRFCIGKRLGKLQAKVGVVTYLRNFKYKLHPKTVLPLVLDESSLFLTDKYKSYLQGQRI